MKNQCCTTYPPENFLHNVSRLDFQEFLVRQAFDLLGLKLSSTRRGRHGNHPDISVEQLKERYELLEDDDFVLYKRSYTDTLVLRSKNSKKYF